MRNITFTTLLYRPTAILCSNIKSMDIAYTARILRALIALAALTLFIYPVYAEGPIVRITEIMYNAEGRDEGKEFVEIVNTGPGEIDMTTVQFFERSDRQKGRTIAQGQGSTILQPGDVAVIVANPEKFLENYTFTGTILDTTIFALLNAGTTVSLQKDTQLLHSVTYAIQNGASGDGNSLHIAQNDSITAGTPSPGVVENITIDTSTTTQTPDQTQTETQPTQPTPTDTDTTPSDTETASTETETQTSTNSPSTDTSASTTQEDTTAAPSTDTTDTEEEDEEEAEVVTKPVLTSDPPVIFLASTTAFSVTRQRDGEEETLYGLWNFGDGGYTYGNVVEHAYLHTGDYIIVFQELSEDGSEGIALQKEIQVVFPQVHLERIDDAFIRLHNRHAFILDISGWRIESQGTIFTFPEKSLVPKRKSIVIPFSVPEGQEIFFITAGGGQFSGKQKQPDTTKAQPSTATKQKTGAGKSKQATKESKAKTERYILAEQDTNSEQKISYSKNSTGVFDTDSAKYQEEEKQGGNMRMVLVWLALLIGIITIALVPLLLARQEKRKHLDHA